MGVVVGKTWAFGNNVKLYRGVSLAARSFAKDDNEHVIKGANRLSSVQDNFFSKFVVKESLLLPQIRLRWRSLSLNFFNDTPASLDSSFARSHFS